MKLVESIVLYRWRTMTAEEHGPRPRSSSDGSCSNIILTSGVFSGATRLSSDERNTFASRWVGGLLMYPTSLFPAPTTVLLCSIVSVKLRIGWGKLKFSNFS